MKSKLLAGAAVAAAAVLTRDHPEVGARERSAPPPARGERLATFSGSSYDPQTRTAEVTFATGVRVTRYGYAEELEISAKAVDLTRVGLNQCRLLFNHDIDQPIGVVTNVRISNGSLVGEIKFAQTPLGDQYAGMVQRGELTGISIGYFVRTWNIVDDVNTEIDVWRAVSWELLEASLVTVPADPLAGVRSATPSAAGATPEEEDMRRNHPSGGATATAPAAETAAPAAAAAPTITAEAIAEAVRSGVAQALSAHQPAPAPVAAAPAETQPASESRVAPEVITPADVLALQLQARGLGVEEACNTAIAVSGATRASVRDAILEAAATAQRAATGGTGSVPAGEGARTGREETVTQRNAMTEALVARMQGAAPSDLARPFMYTPIAEMLAARAGINSRNPSEILTRAMQTTSDFPLLLEDAANKVLMAAFQVATPTYRKLAAKKPFNDFKPHKFLRLGDFPALQNVTEGGEIKFGSFGENREEASLTTKGIIVALSRQAIINDDLSAFSDLIMGAGLEASRTENYLFYQLLLANNALSDGVALFHANHGNLGTASAINIASVSAARSAMRKQKGVGKKGAAGVQPLNITPSLLLVGPDKETEAQQLVAPIQATQEGNVNPFSGLLDIVTDANLADLQWYAFANPGVLPVFIYGYLRDAEGPQIVQNQPFNVDGVSLRVLHDFGVGQVDFRGGYKNPGA